LVFTQRQRVLSKFSVPSDPEYLRQWHLHTHYNDPDYDQHVSVNCEDAWRLLDHFGSSEVVVAITDDGCKLDHNDFDSPGKFADWGYFRGERLIISRDLGADPAQMIGRIFMTVRMNCVMVIFPVVKVLNRMLTILPMMD
jgi:hypothetical protein